MVTLTIWPGSAGDDDRGTGVLAPGSRADGVSSDPRSSRARRRRRRAGCSPASAIGGVSVPGSRALCAAPAPPAGSAPELGRRRLVRACLPSCVPGAACACSRGVRASLSLTMTLCSSPLPSASAAPACCDLDLPTRRSCPRRLVRLQVGAFEARAARRQRDTRVAAAPPAQYAGRTARTT